MSDLSDIQLLTILQIYVQFKGRVADIGALSDIKRATLEELKILKLLKIGPRDTDQAVPVKLTRKCSHIASMMLIEGRIIRGELK